MLNGLNGWFTPGGRLGISELADRYAELAVRLVTAY
jgi:hypothetical protein